MWHEFTISHSVGALLAAVQMGQKGTDVDKMEWGTRCLSCLYQKEYRPSCFVLNFIVST